MDREGKNGYRYYTEVCSVCLSESEGKIGLEGNKMNLQKDAFLKRVA